MSERYVPFDAASEIIYETIGVLKNGRITYRQKEIAYALRPEEIKIGLRVRYLLGAYQIFRGPSVPPAIFILCKVIKIWGDHSSPLMTLKSLDKAAKYTSISCGIKEHARFCLPEYVKVKPLKPKDKKP